MPQVPFNQLSAAQKQMRILNKRMERMSEWYSFRSMLGNATWAIFFIAIGAREAGKSYDAMDWCLRQYFNRGEIFYWIRLTTVSAGKLLKNDADQFVDPDLVRKYNLNLTVKGLNVYNNGKLMARVLALSEMAKEKGVAFFDKDYKGHYNIIVDEFQREPNEVKRFDILYNLVGTLENLVRSVKERVKIFMICNLLEEANDVLIAFNFVPEHYGRFKLKSKRAVIDYIPPSDKYKKRRKGTVADLLMPDASNFTNEIKKDIRLLYKGRTNRPTAIIKFYKEPSTWFTIWDGSIIKPYKNEKKPIIAMRMYIDEFYSDQLVNDIIARYNARDLKFTTLLCQKRFEKALSEIKKAK